MKNSNPFTFVAIMMVGMVTCAVVAVATDITKAVQVTSLPKLSVVQWEYKVLYVKMTTRLSHANEAGKDGWEMVSYTITDAAWQEGVLWFKRPKSSSD